MTIKWFVYVLVALVVFIILWMIFFSIGSGEVDIVDDVPALQDPLK
jgi:hypothetical protein